MANKKNVFQRYFENFGLKQICDIFMIVALILLVVGWIIWQSTDIVLICALALFVLTSVLRIIRCIVIIKGEPNKRSPERRAAVLNIFIMLCILAVSLFGLIWGLTVGFVVPAV